MSATSERGAALAETQIAELLRQRHRIPEEEPDDFRIQNMSDAAAASGQVLQIMTMLLAGIAGISLLVGGIGIMNIMLVSVTERTREIGIRMAVGARPSYIRLQFLTESVVLSLTGGIVGMLIGGSAAAAFAWYLDWPSSGVHARGHDSFQLFDCDRGLLRILPGSQGRGARSD